MICSSNFLLSLLLSVSITAIMSRIFFAASSDIYTSHIPHALSLALTSISDGNRSCLDLDVGPSDANIDFLIFSNELLDIDELVMSSRTSSFANQFTVRSLLISSQVSAPLESRFFELTTTKVFSLSEVDSIHSLAVHLRRFSVVISGSVL